MGVTHRLEGRSDRRGAAEPVAEEQRFNVGGGSEAYYG
jgi:hypothetical protein